MIWAISIKQAFVTLNRNRKLIGIALDFGGVRQSHRPHRTVYR